MKMIENLSSRKIVISTMETVKCELLENQFFLISLFIIFSVLFLEFPSLSYRSEIWAEQGTNYLINARYLSFFKNLFVTDAGYLVIFPRIIAVLTYYVFPLEYYAFITNLCGLFFASLSAAFFSRKCFRHIISSDFVRFIISLLLGFGISNNYENHTYVNFVYHMCYFCFFAIFCDKTKMNRFVFVLFTVVNALVCCSKFHFVLFFVPYFIFAVIAIKKRAKRDSIFYCTSIFMICVQLAHTLLTYKQSGWIQSQVVSSGNPKSIFITLPALVIKAFMFHIQSYANKLDILYCIFIVCTICFVVYKLYKALKLSREQVNFFVLANYVSVGFLGISSLVHLKTMQIGSELGLGRATFVSIEITFVAICLVLYHLWEWKRSFLIPIVVFALYSHNFAHFGSHLHLNRDRYANPQSSRSQWKAYNQLFSYEDYYIPINPPLKVDGWAISRNASIVGRATAGDVAEIPITQNVSLRALFTDLGNIEVSGVNAYSYEGKLLGTGKILSGTFSKTYVLFENKVQPDYICFLGKNGTKIPILKGTVISLIGTELPLEEDNSLDELFE